MTTHELVVDPGGDIGDREPPLLFGDRGMELDLVQQIAEFLDHVHVGARIVGVERLDRIDHLVGLLDQVRHQRLVGLLDVPRALLAQRARQLMEFGVPLVSGDPERRYVERREMVGLDHPVHVGPRGLHDLFVGCAERDQQHDRRVVEVAARVVDRQLDVGQHPVGVGVCDQQRSAVSARRAREPVSVDQPHAGLDRVDPEPGPHEVEERHRRQHGDGDPGVVEQHSHRALQHERRAGNRVQHVAVLDGSGHELFCDRGVDVLEPLRLFVQGVERGRIGYQVCRGMNGRAKKPVTCPLDRLRRLGGHMLDPAGTQPDHHDPGQHDPGQHDPGQLDPGQLVGHAQPAGVTERVAASQVPNRGSTSTSPVAIAPSSR